MDELDELVFLLTDDRLVIHQFFEIEVLPSDLFLIESH